MRTLIIIPTYNEIENLQKLTEEIFSKLAQTDILVIDDNSPDGTGELAEKLAHKDPRIKLIKRPVKSGLGSAYVCGFKYALNNNYDFVFEMDGDFSHSPEYLPDFLKHTSEYNLILGSRYVKGAGITNWGIWRRLLSAAANFYARIILGLPYRDLTGGFKCYSRQLLKNLNLDSIISEGYVFQIETTYRVHLKGYPIK
ncbi:MAG: polyprenol monophosphomannose synthase, partial [Omnitrophica bacterium]|nr:polyprenol monophosphomannose synthase [Candidatus Omnitrophota bacterium]